MSKRWKDPAKQPPSPETMNTPGDFGQFTDMMRRLMKVKPSDVARVPGASTSGRSRSPRTA